jgi:hypothetical protein
VDIGATQPQAIKTAYRVQLVRDAADKPADIDAVIDGLTKRGKQVSYTVRTNEQLAREYEALKRVYNERLSRQGQGGGRPASLPAAAARSEETSGKHLPEVASGDEKKPTVKAAEALGKSRPTLDKAAAVVRVIDGLAGAGNAAAAAEPVPRRHGGAGPD